MTDDPRRYTSVMGDVTESTVSPTLPSKPRPFGSETRAFDKSPITARKVDFGSYKGAVNNGKDSGTSKGAETDLSKSTTSTQTTDEVRNLKKSSSSSHSQPILRKTKSGTIQSL